MDIDIHKKEQEWTTAVERFSNVKDALGKPIDAGILETVVALNLLGVHTIASCEGHVDWGTRSPWVDIAARGDEFRKWNQEATKASQEAMRQRDLRQLPQEEIAHLFEEARQLQRRVKRLHLAVERPALELLALFYEHRQVPYDQRLTIQTRVDRGRIESQGAHFQDTAPLGNLEEKLQEYQQEMSAFGNFLKDLWFSR